MSTHLFNTSYTQVLAVAGNFDIFKNLRNPKDSREDEKYLNICQMLSRTQLFTLAFIPKPAALLSSFSSGFVIFEIIRSPERRCRMYHRIVLCMNISNSLMCCCYFLGTWAIPSGTPGVLGAVGNDLTCKIQATLLTCPGLSVLFYYFSLSVLSYIAVKNDFDEKKYKKIEPLIHAVSIGFPLCLAVIALKNHYFNPAGPWCWVESFPPGCEAIEGLECIHQVNPLYTATIASLTNVLTFLMIVMMFLIYCKIRTIEKKIEAAAKEEGEILKFRGQKSRIILLQVLLYFLAFFMAFGLVIVARIYQWKTGSHNISLITAAVFFSPLQGFFNMIVYVFLRNSARNRSSFDYFVLRKLTTVNAITKSQENTESDPEAASEDTNVDEANRNTPQSYQFSIFEGPNPPEKWNDFIGVQER